MTASELRELQLLLETFVDEEMICDGMCDGCLNYGCHVNKTIHMVVGTAEMHEHFEEGEHP